MPQTPVSLLESLRQQPTGELWQQLVDLYSPLLASWLRRSLQAADVEDLVQDVLTAVVQELPHFQHGGNGSFRAWLKTILRHRLLIFWEKRDRRPEAGGDDRFEHTLNQLADPHSELSRLWDQEHDQHVVRRLLALVKPQFKPSTWQAFWRTVMEAQEVAVVARELGLSVSSVWQAKSRVLRQLREVSKGLLD